MTALFGGAFDPPHNGHVALARAARERFPSEPLVVLVNEDPGHKRTEAPAEVRLQLAHAAFPDLTVEPDPYRYTVELLKAGRWPDPLFVIGADEFVDFPTWKRPNDVLGLAPLAVATRPGYPRERLDGVLAGLEHPDRVSFFAIESLRISSRELRELVRGGRPIDAFVPQAVARLISELGLYREASEAPR